METVLSVLLPRDFQFPKKALRPQGGILNCMLQFVIVVFLCQGSIRR